ncbi:hypothetical protein Tco_1060831 [Tanacetum coccineum]
MVELSYQGCKPDPDTKILLKMSRFLSWVEAGKVSPEVESEKWRRLLLHWMYDAFDVSTDEREEDFFPQNGM